MARGIAQNQGKSCDTPGDHRSRPYHGVAVDDVAAHYDCVGADTCTFLDQSWPVLVLAGNMASRVNDVGEHHTRSTEHIVFQDYGVIDGNVILNFHVIADAGLAHVNVLAKRAVLADDSISLHVGPVPNTRSFADLRPSINDSGLVRPIAHINNPVEAKPDDRRGRRCR